MVLLKMPPASEYDKVLTVLMLASGQDLNPAISA